VTWRLLAPALVASTLLASGPRVRPAGAQDAPVYLTVRDSAAHLYRGERSGYADATRLVVRDSVAWRGVWQTLHTGVEPPPLPSVDFRHEVVVLAALGARLRSGHAIAIDTVRRSGEEIEAVVRTTVPAAGCAGAPSVVQPVDVVRVPRSERAVAFTERRQAPADCR
jgi:hypothetical protein